MATVTISLPDPIAKQVDFETKKQGFATRSEFVRSLLRKHLPATKAELKFVPFKKKPLKEIRADFEKTGKYNKKFIDSLIRGLSQASIYAGKTTE